MFFFYTGIIYRFYHGDVRQDQAAVFVEQAELVVDDDLRDVIVFVRILSLS